MPPNPNLPAFEKFGRFIDPSEDPTKSKGARRRFTAAATRRWQPSKQYVREQVITNDVFGLNGGGNPVLSDAQRMDRFMMGLEQVQSQSILERARGTIPWITPFVREAFIKGMIRGNKDLQALARGARRERAKAIKASPAGETPVSDLAEREVERARNAAYRVNQTAEDIFIAPTLDPDNLQDALQAGERARLFELEVTRTWQGITGVAAQVNTQVAAVIADGLEARSTPRQLAKDINARIDAVGVTRSQMIARTETVAANNRGAVAEFAEAERLTGFDVLVQWETALDSRVRDTHIVRHGDVYTKEAGLSLIGEPNCLLPDAVVFSPSRIERVFKRRYYGRIITIKTASGNELTCTPNHPILTRDGAATADTLNVGGHVLCSTVADSPEAITENEDHVKARIEDVASAFSLTANRAITTCGVLDFHGDGIDGEVAVVSTDRELMGTVKAVGVAKKPREFFFKRVCLGLRLAASRTIAKLRIGAYHASNCIMRRLDLMAAFALRHAGPFDPLGFALTPGGDPILFKNTVNGPASYADLFADGVSAAAFSEETTDEALVNPVYSAANRSKASETDAPLDNLVGDSMLNGEFFKGAPFGEVFADEIVDIKVGMYSGHVYNLQCRVGTYIAQNILQNNCRCALLPYIPAIEGKVDLSSGKAAKALTPDEAKARAERERKKLGLPKGQEGKPVKRRAKK